LILPGASRRTKKKKSRIRKYCRWNSWFVGSNSYQMQKTIPFLRGVYPDVSEYIEVARITEFHEGQMKKIMAGNQEILLARVKEQFYAVDARCPHLGGDLSEGTLRDTILTCPVHHSQFDLRDGHVVRWTDLTGIRFSIASQQHPPRTLHRYLLRREGEKILINLAGS
jgi:3-phenylpropionate/trans-cinnamate dioxygenase ferredoxin subunit